MSGWMQVSWRFRREAISFGTVLLFCVAAMLVVAAPRALSAPASKPYIVVLNDDVAHPANVAERHEENRGADVEHVYRYAIEGYSAELTPSALKAIKQDPNVDYVERDQVLYPASQNPSFAIPRVGANTNPRLDIDEQDDAPIDADIAIIDSGVAPHNDLNIAGRTECVGAGSTGSCVDGSGFPTTNGHGTHVAGIAAARDNGEGVVGGAPGARIWSVRVIGNDGIAHNADLLAGVDWVTARSSMIEVANMSLSCTCTTSQASLEAITASINKGVVYTVAAGNDSHNAALNFPAWIPQVITVAAITDYNGVPGGGGDDWCEEGDFDDWIAHYSNYGAVVDIAAPGTCIRSTWLNGGYAWRDPADEFNMSGTSMAAPLVAGAAAVMASQSNPETGADVEAIRNALRSQGTNRYYDNSGESVKPPLLDMSNLTAPTFPPPPPPPPPPPSAPTVSAVSVTDIRQTSAVLRGTVNQHGVDGRYKYDCESSTGSTFSSPAAEGEYMPAGSSDVEVPVYINNLQPGTTYHCRLWANNAGGANTSPYQYFTTKGPPLAVTLRPTAATKSSVTMAAKIDGLGEPGVTYRFQWGPTTGYGYQSELKMIPGEPSGFQQVTAVAGSVLPVGWPVHYRVMATSAGMTVYGEDQMGTTAWSTEPNTVPGGVVANWLDDVSCPVVGSCMAVGGSRSSNGEEAVAGEKWNGTAWTPAMPPAPVGIRSQLYGVSCAAATSCMAVGEAHPSAGDRPLAMQWNGSAWAETSPAVAGPAGYRNYLNDVACTAANSCEAVGYSAPASGAEIIKPLVSHWNGTTWTIKTSANPITPGGEPSLEDNILRSVSCASATVCKAVGVHYSSVSGVQAAQPLIESLNGSGEWVAEEADTAVAKGKGQTNIWLEGVSCPTASFCAAVGYAATSPTAAKVPFTQAWNASKWSESSPASEANGPTQLLGVSCTSPSACRAVGPGQRGLHWTGSAWKAEAPVAPSDAGGSTLPKLAGVSCPTAAECHAVGDYRTPADAIVPLTQAWSGAGVVPQAKGKAATHAPGATTATLRGSVDPGGVDTGYYFEYGPTEAYGSKTAETSAGSWAIEQGSPYWIEAATEVSGLLPATTYHFRIAATNGFSTTYGPDTTFDTGGMQAILNDMPVTEPFNATTSPVSDFTTKWAKPGWVTGANGKGKNNTNGWGALETTASAYFTPTINDTGPGVGAVATMSVGGVGFSLWLDMPTPTATTKSGYELRLLSGTLTLVKWVAGTQTTLGTKTGYTFPLGSSLALADRGATVEAWANTGTGFTKLLSASDSTYSGGNTGVEAIGTTIRLTKFRAGALLEKVTGTDAALKAIPVTDLLNKAEYPVSGAGAWSALFWDTKGPYETGVDDSTGWSSAGSPPEVFGAYWKKAASADSGGGDATIATFGAPSGFGYGYFSLWLNAPSPGTVKSGYELRLTETSVNAFEAKINKWVGGVATALASKTGIALFGGRKIALVDKGGVVSAWITDGVTPYAQILTASDSTYSYGYGGIEASAMPPLKLKEFKLGPLPPQ